MSNMSSGPAPTIERFQLTEFGDINRLQLGYRLNLEYAMTTAFWKISENTEMFRIEYPGMCSQRPKQHAQTELTLCELFSIRNQH